MSVQDDINKILWNRRIVPIPEHIDRPPGLDYVVLRDLTVEDRNLYLFLRDVEQQRATAEGVPSEKELLVLAREGGYWGQFDDDIEAKSEDHLAFLRAEFEAKKKFRARQNIIKLQIDDVLAKQEVVKRKHMEFRMNSAEYAAHEFASLALLRRVACDIHNNEIFKDEQEFVVYKQSYIIFLYYLIERMMNEGTLPTKDIRAIAKSPEWRLVWILSRENLPAIFNRPISDLTLNHRLLIYWSRVYDSAYERPEPPSNDIVNDDDRFDEWLAEKDMGVKSKSEQSSDHQEEGRTIEGYFIEECYCGMKAKNKGRGLGERLPHQPHCPYGVWHENTPEERAKVAERIYGRNNPAMRKFMNTELDNVDRKGLVEEQHLRGQKSRQVLGLETKVTKRQR